MIGVEAAVISAVVSGILKILRNKLATTLIRNFGSIEGVEKDLDELRVLVENINTWLEGAGDQAMGDDASFNWLKQLKDVAHNVEDVVDEFQLEAERNDACGAGGILSKYMPAKSKSFIFQCKAAKKITKIKKEFAAIVKQRSDFNAISNCLLVGHSVQHIIKTNEDRTSLPTVDVAKVLGRDQEKHQIISKLVETNDQLRIRIVSVIGLGGSGKTTLAKLVFNDSYIIEKHFNVRLWVHVSQEFNVKELIGKLFEALTCKKYEHYPLQHMINIISEELTNKKFLIVLDDVWTDSRIQWDEFMEHLKSGLSASRVLLTTRSRKVAKILGSTCLFDIPFLSEDDSWQLFQRYLVMPATVSEFEIEKVGKEIVKKCGGVPLAIKVLAGVFHEKEQIKEWEAVLHSNLLDVEGREDRIHACLGLSYFHLPSHLKQCFTICSVFPKGHKIDKEKLIDQWIAHDMITPEPGLDLEYIGHKYFNSLVQVCFLQDVDEYNGRVNCRMHDLVHDFAQSILGDKISLVLEEDATSFTKSCRYFSLKKDKINIVPKHLFQKARVIHIDDIDDKEVFGKAFENARHLRSVTIECMHNTAALTAISLVQSLKYLEITELWCKDLPEAFSNIWSLQALHVSSGCLVELPKSIGNLQKLRTLNLSGCERLICLPDSIGDCQMISSIDLRDCYKLTILPNSIGQLQKLRILNLSSCSRIKCLPDTIGDCQMISSISLRNCSELTMLPNSIGKLQKLTTLNLYHCEELNYLPDSIGDCHMISRIDLCYCKKLTMLPNSIGRIKKLRFLILSNTNIVRLPSNITGLINLECLDLSGCGKLVELPEGIVNLERLQVLNLNNCYNLRGIPLGIGQLSKLQKLGLFVVADSFFFERDDVADSEKFARISELANVCRNMEDLTISGIDRVMEPDDAYRACLKQNTNLKRLTLKWKAHNTGGVNTELYEAVLDGLEPPPGIKVLEISGYSGRQYARWMQNKLGGCVLIPLLLNNLQRHSLEKNLGGTIQGFSLFPFLRVMSLYYFPNLKHLCGLALLPCLEELELQWMPSLESISGGPFPSLVKLVMRQLPSLAEVWLVAERTMLDATPHLGHVRVGNCMSDISISDCPMLKVKPYLPSSLQRLCLYEGSEQLLQRPGQWSPNFGQLKRLELHGMKGLGSGGGWELLQHMTAIESFEINSSNELTELPESLWSLTSLRSLTVSSCAIHILPECLRSLTSLRSLEVRSCSAILLLPESLGELWSLGALKISSLPGLTCLPHSLCGLTFLEELSIWDCPGLTSFPQGMKRLVSLEKLLIYWCPGIKSMPEDIKCLTAMKQLWIHGCPDLVRRCSQGDGEDWHLISHIPRLFIEDPYDSESD